MRRGITIAAITAVALVALLSAQPLLTFLREEFSDMNCYRLDQQTWDETLDAMPMQLTPLDRRVPVRVQLELDFPLLAQPRRGDMLRITAISDQEDVVFAGPVPENRIVDLMLPGHAAGGPLEYWMGFTLLRPDDRMQCGWNLEEQFALPAAPRPERWRVELLSQALQTDDGGQRLTRFTPKAE